MISYVELVGLTAGFLGASGWVPQILRVRRMKDAQEISLAFNLLSFGGTALWLSYGLVLGLLSVIVWNSVNCVLLVLLLTVKLKYGMGRIPPRSNKSIQPQNVLIRQEGFGVKRKGQFEDNLHAVPGTCCPRDYRTDECKCLL
jgi:MtN3 and saliva related transmembrane protein